MKVDWDAFFDDLKKWMKAKPNTKPIRSFIMAREPPRLRVSPKVFRFRDAPVPNRIRAAKASVPLLNRAWDMSPKLVHKLGKRVLIIANKTIGIKIIPPGTFL